MQKSKPAASPDAYVSALRGWKRELVEQLRSAVQGAAKLEEVIKWRHIVCFSNGPLLLIRAEQERVLFGFWRGKRLREIDDRLKPGGKYELATMELRKEMEIEDRVVRKLVRESVKLNKQLGDPTKIG